MSLFKDRSFQPKRSRQFYLLLASAILFGLLFVIGILPRLNNWSQLEQRAEASSLPTALVFEVKADRQPISLVLPSTTNALRATPIWARVDGYLDNFFVDIGDHVEEGELLALIDTPEIDKQLLQAKADLLRAQAQLEIAQVSAKRWESLFQKNSQAVSRQEVDERAATLSSSEASVEALRANVERLEKLQAFKRIIAPFSGVITERNVDIGSLISAGSAAARQQLFNLAKIDVIRVFVEVPQSFYRRIAIDQEAEVMIREFPHHIFTGKVARTAGALDPVARTLLTEIHIDNRNRLLTTGLYAEVKFLLVPDQAYFIIPTNALIIRSGPPQVAVLDADNRAALFDVELGRDFGKTMEIISGLKDGDRIIANPTDRIQTGTQVQIISPPKV